MAEAWWANQEPIVGQTITESLIESSNELLIEKNTKKQPDLYKFGEKSMWLKIIMYLNEKMWWKVDAIEFANNEMSIAWQYSDDGSDLELALEAFEALFDAVDISYLEDWLVDLLDYGTNDESDSGYDVYTDSGSDSGGFEVFATGGVAGLVGRAFDSFF